MTIGITHPFVNPKADGPDATIARPSDWNAAHTLTGLGTGVETALGINVGTIGSVIVNGGALGTPSGGTLTNATGLPEGGLALTDITTNNSSTSKHGFLLKLNNSATQFMNGQGAWATPASSLTIGQAVSGGNANSVLFEDGSQNLAASTALTFIAATAILSINSPAAQAPTIQFNAPTGQQPEIDWFINGALKAAFYTDATTTSLSNRGSNMDIGGAAAFQLRVNTSGLTTRSDTVYGFSSGANVSNTVDASFNRQAAGIIGVDTGSTGFAGAMKMTRLFLDYTNTGTVGSVTINKASGTVNLAALGSALTLTNSLITANSHLIVTLASDPGVALAIWTVCGAGSATINTRPATVNQTAVDFVLINAD